MVLRLSRVIRRQVILRHGSQGRLGDSLSGRIHKCSRHGKAMVTTSVELGDSTSSGMIHACSEHNSCHLIGRHEYSGDCPDDVMTGMMLMRQSMGFSDYYECSGKSSWMML